MAVATIEELRSAFEDGQPERIIGTLESGWVDFKSQPYPLSTDRGAWELCKDVAGLANANSSCRVRAWISLPRCTVPTGSQPLCGNAMRARFRSARTC